MPAESMFFEETIGASQSATSPQIVLRENKDNHALQYQITGDGTVDLKVLTGSDTANWINNGVKGDNLTKTSGPDSDGKDIIPLSLKPGDFIKVVATEVGTSNEVVLSLWMVQK